MQILDPFISVLGIYCCKKKLPQAYSLKQKIFFLTYCFCALKKLEVAYLNGTGSASLLSFHGNMLAWAAII